MMLGLLSPLKDIASSSAKSFLATTKNNMICWAIIVFAAVMAVIFLCLIAFLGLLEVMSPLWAATVLFGFWIIVALVAFITNKIMTTKKKRQLEEQRRREETSALISSAALAALPLLTNRKALLAIGIPLVGLLAASFLKNDTE